MYVVPVASNTYTAPLMKEALAMQPLLSRSFDKYAPEEAKEELRLLHLNNANDWRRALHSLSPTITHQTRRLVAGMHSITVPGIQYPVATSATPATTSTAATQAMIIQMTAQYPPPSPLEKSHQRNVSTCHHPHPYLGVRGTLRNESRHQREQLINTIQAVSLGC